MKLSQKRKLIRIGAGAVAGLLAFLMLFGLVADLFFRTNAAAASQAEINALKEKLKESAAEKKQLQQKLESIDRDKATIKSQIEALDQQIANTEGEIDLQNQLIEQLQGMIAQKELELEEAQKEEEVQYEKFKTRVRVMYEQGDASYLEVLLASDSVSDFLSRYEIVSQIAKYDKGLFEKLKAAKEAVAQKKAELEASQAEAEEAKAGLEATKRDLDAQLENRSAAMRELENASDEVKASYQEIEDEEADINAQIDKMAKELAEQERRRQEEAARIAAQNSGSSGQSNQSVEPVQTSSGYTFPLPSGYRRVTSRFGNRKHPITGQYKLHTGVDISAPNGTTIMAAKSGTVIIAGRSTAYGNYVVINHGGGLTTLYAHMSKLGTTKGATVNAGDTIGYVGSTGYSTGNHLHFEVRLNGSYQDAGSILGLY